MGVYINMEMPKCCGVCPFCVPEADKDNGDICVLCGQFPLIKQERSIECPLVPVPPHGRLIDADTLVRELTSIRASFGSANGLVEGGLNIAVSTVNGRSTIIPASEEGE